MLCVYYRRAILSVMCLLQELDRSNFKCYVFITGGRQEKEV